MLLIAEPQNHITYVDNLDEGPNIFIWSLSNGACIDYSLDTMTIYHDKQILANPDVTTVNFNEVITGFDLTLNDAIGLTKDWAVHIIEYPRFGNIEFEDEGIISFTPNTNFFGRDYFIYNLCNVACPDICDTAKVSINVMGMSTDGICFVPNVITPNGDQTNESLVIPCLESYPNNQIVIFNRLGKRLFEAAPYENDWHGTYDGQNLPVGTYFYILRLDENSNEEIQGFIHLNAIINLYSPFGKNVKRTLTYEKIFNNNNYLHNHLCPAGSTRRTVHPVYVQ